MEGQTFISWNIPNFITVTLIAVIGVVLLKAGAAAWQARSGQ